MNIKNSISQIYYLSYFLIKIIKLNIKHCWSKYLVLKFNDHKSAYIRLEQHYPYLII